ncbi:N-acetylmuramic acid 6-phosphate etherase [Kosakonia sp. SMBL-WEM22]|uniref:N-acetylmuramic acid 6-phosphate etherase n=1 Tax=Kosakonia sp. SMBL-WEM22 TaxID=2725560 RepID=UPI0016591DFF|nr:N-acetylmuramic acid 6-phosphate etherase [Kosakonia sp. SMBL-WEM22]QNQ20590.1 N-acetylmuramic acid 6-phosphate etherase [Kosakonia sp. SMBL-WEM22]
MSSKPNGSMEARRNPRTGEIDRLATLDMLTLIHQESEEVTQAVTACLPAIARLVDNASATLSRGGRVVLAGAGSSGRAAMQTVEAFAPDNQHGLLALMAGGAQSARAQQDRAAGDYDCGGADLQALGLTARDMLVALSLSGTTPWTSGVLQRAQAVGARVVLVTRAQACEEAAQFADMVIAPDSGAEAVSGFSEPKAQLAQQQILAMLSTGLAVRCGRVYSNLRVDIAPVNLHWAERQIAVVMAASSCTREEAKRALAQANNECRAAILMLLTGVSASRAQVLLAENHRHLRLAITGAKSAGADA